MSDPKPPPPTPERRRGIFDRAQQAAAAASVAAVLVVMAAWWVVQGGLRGRMIDLERAPRQQAAYQVDANAAAWPELAQMPGIGPTLAHRIVESRQQHGPFRDPEDLMRVRGIGPKTLERMRPYLLPMPERQTVAGP